MVLRLPPRAPAPSICLSCLFQLRQSSLPRRSLSTLVQQQPVKPLRAVQVPWKPSYFLSNRSLSDDAASSSTTPPQLLPHRRRQQLRKTLENADDPNAPLPPDASSLLSTSSASSPTGSLKRLLYPYLALSKPRLTVLVVLSAMAPYALYPTDPLLATTTAPTLSALTLTFLTIGTTLSSASANAFNMYLEPEHDRKMSRTRNRPLVRGLIKPAQALAFAVGTGILGTTALYFGVNPTVAALGAANIVLYAAVYTPMKRLSVVNTWVGAIVGGIPPLMGWAAAAGAGSVEGAGVWENLAHPGGWLLAGLLFAWQFPHFNSLSWTIREEYRAAGYQMMAWKYPKLNGRVALRYSLLFFPICVGLWMAGVVDAGFVVDSSVVNGWLVREAWRFYKKGGEGGTAKRLFWASVWHLPVVMGLAMVHKAGLWRGVWDWAVGKGEEDEYEYEDEEEEQQAVATVAMRTK